ncbi:unnamed protein product [Coregonus sp. 'balchen']|nr:unnamed protein product [Coregonus sp. 'balchen']
MLAKVLEDWLHTALPYVVHEDQTCGIEGRSIRWNLSLIRDSITWVEDRGLPLMVAALDQAKAFDRVNRYFIFRVLGRLGFGEKYIGWIRALYVGAGYRVNVNGHMGEIFYLASGVRQGCPLSALLFVLYMELPTTLPCYYARTCPLPLLGNSPERRERFSITEDGVGGRMCQGGLSLCIGALKILGVLFETSGSAGDVEG